MVDAGMWRAVGTLLRLRTLIFASGFRRATLRHKIGLGAVGLLLLAFLGLIFFASWGLLRFLRSPELAQGVGDPRLILVGMPVLVFGSAFLGLLLTSFGVLLQALYLAGDMDFLLSAPVPLRAIFVAKQLQAILPSFGLICLFAVPVLYGMGTAAGYNWLYYPLVLALLAALAVAAAGLASVLVMAVVRVFPARRVAEVLAFSGGVASLLCSQIGSFGDPTSPSASQASAVLRLVAAFNTPWSPLAWAGRGLVAIGERRWLEGLVYVGLSMGLAGMVFGVTLALAERLYYRGWAGLQDHRRKRAVLRQTHGARPMRWAAQLLSGIPAPVRAMVVKDARVLRRDLRNLSQLITPLILGIVYASALVRSGGTPPPGQGEAPAWFIEGFRGALEFGNVVIALIVGSALVGRLAGMGFSQEGRSYWLVKTAPVSTLQLLAAKFAVAYLPALALSWVFLVTIAALHGAAQVIIGFALPMVALSLAGLTGINLAFGIMGANMNWEDPRHMQRSGSGCLAVLVSFAYLVAALGLFLLPTFGLALLSWPAFAGELVGLALGGLFSLACAWLPLRLTSKHVPRLGES